MWKLKKPSLQEAKNDIDIAFSKTVKDGHDTSLLKVKEKNELKALYDEYDVHKGRPLPASVKRVCTSKANDIKKKYASIQKGKNLFYIRQSLFKGVAYCPYCSITEPLQLDHYMPESQYPVLAINRQNLVPLCPYCNNTKKAKDYKKFIHPYYDEFPRTEFFIIKTNIVHNQLSFEYELDDVPFIGNEETLQRIKNQWKELKLTEQWDKAINQFIFSFFPNDICNGTDEALKIYLNDRYLQYKCKYGLNDWRTALLRSLKDNPNFTTGVLKNSLNTLTIRENEVLI